MRYRRFYIGLETDSTGYHEHGGDGEGTVAFYRRERDGQLYPVGSVRLNQGSKGITIRILDAGNRLVAALLNGIPTEEVEG